VAVAARAAAARTDLRQHSRTADEYGVGMASWIVNLVVVGTAVGAAVGIGATGIRVDSPKPVPVRVRKNRRR